MITIMLNALGLNNLGHWLRRKDPQDWQELSDYMKRDSWPDG